MIRFAMPWLYLALFLGFTGNLGAEILTVNADGEGADFIQIQPAIDSAVAGDRILVAPSATAYDGFRLDKDVLIRCQDCPGSARFGVTGDVIIEERHGEVPAGISGMKLLDGQLTVRNNSGEILLENIRSLSQGDDTKLVIQSSANVAVHRYLNVRTHFDGRYFDDVPPAIAIVDSQVRLADATVFGLTGTNGLCEFLPTGDGGAAVAVSDSSYLELIRPQLEGGYGGDANDHCDDEYCPWPAGKGGAGLILDQGSQILITGNEAHYLRGGTGGVSYQCGGGCYSGFSGDGGVAIVIEGVSEGRISRVLLEGGQPGWCGGGQQGEEKTGTGDLQRQDIFADFFAVKHMRIDKDAWVELDAVVPGNFLLLISDVGGFQSVSEDVIGGQLGVLPGGRFDVAIQLGRTDSDGDLRFDFPIPDWLSLVATPLHFQGIVFGEDGKLYLTPPVTRVVDDKPRP